MAPRRRKKRNQSAGSNWAVGAVVLLALVLGMIAVLYGCSSGYGPSGEEVSIPAGSAQEASSEAASVTPLSLTPASSEKASSAAVSSKIPAVIPDGEFVTPKGYTVVTRNGISTVNGVLIVNKTYSIPANYASGLDPEMLSAFNEMAAAAKEEMGYTLTIFSGFRSHANQIAVYNGHVASKGKTRADQVSARPGHSEHETGLTADINDADSSKEPPEEIVWMDENCWKYGFILRYPQGAEELTGYQFEPWHMRYIGDKELAETLYNNGEWISLEEYFGLTSVYAQED